MCFAEITELLTVASKDVQDLLAKFPNLLELQKSILNQYWKKDDDK